MKDQRIIEGEVKKNPYGNWDDVDKGIYVNGENIKDIFLDYIGEMIKITIKVTPLKNDDE